MDPLTGGIVAGLIVNGITEAVRYAMTESRTPVDPQEAIAAILQRDKSVGDILQKAVMAVARSVHRQDDKQSENLRLFFLSPEAEAVVRQLCGLYFAPEARSKSESNLREEFVLSLAYYLGTDNASVRPIADPLFEAIVQACDRALTLAVNDGILAAHDARSSIRHRILLDEIAAVQKSLEFMRRGQRPTVDDLLMFERKYRAQVADRHGHVTPPNFDVARKIPIKAICVSPNLTRISRNRSDQRDPLILEAFLSGLYRAVVLGNPGGGKSTLANRICHDLASDYRQRIMGGRQLTAALVILRDYGAAKKEHGYSFLQFLETVANSHYQVAPPQGAFEYMLLSGRAMVIFDGLDELLDTRHRQEISADIESFCNLYPAVPVMVTSREVGYEQAPLDETRFVAYRLAPFDPQQVEEYARKWFATDPDLSLPQQKHKAESFLIESRVVADLRSNPLMLSLMCNLYRGDSYIPKNRPDVYEKCATMLFERWDKSRGIPIDLAFEAHINPAMKYLAHWIYADEALQSGVTEEKLITKTTEYLARRRFEDPDEAERAARGFIEFCRGRAWVFTDTGTTKAGDRLYQFTHRTFLEYFTAAHLVRTNPTPELLGSVLGPRIEEGEWDVVAQLAFQLQNKQVEGAADALLLGLLKRSALTSGPRVRNLLSFAARSLEFLVPTPKTTREISLHCLERSFVLTGGNDTDSANGESNIGANFALFSELLTSSVENQGPVVDCIEKDISRRINEAATQEALLATDAGLNLRVALHYGARNAEIGQELFEFWAGISDRIFEACSIRILHLSTTDFPTWIDCYLQGRVDIASFFQLYGKTNLFAQPEHRMFPDMRRASLADTLLWATLIGQPRDKFRPQWEAHLKDLAVVGKYLLASSPPWFELTDSRQDHLFRFRHWAWGKHRWIVGEARLDPDIIFGAFILFATELSEVHEKVDINAVRYLMAAELPLFKRFSAIVLSRWDRQYHDSARKEMAELALSSEQERIIWAWVNREVQFATTVS